LYHPAAYRLPVEEDGSGARRLDAKLRAEAGNARVARGGCWTGPAVLARSAYRYKIAPDLRLENLGLRAARRLSDEHTVVELKFKELEDRMRQAFLEREQQLKAEREALLKRYRDALALRQRAFEHRHRLEMAELDSSQFARRREWDEKQKRERQDFFKSRKDPAERAAFEESVKSRRETLLGIIQDEKKMLSRDFSAKTVRTGTGDFIRNLRSKE
jgi:hypothetical protein